MTTVRQAIDKADHDGYLWGEGELYDSNNDCMCIGGAIAYACGVPLDKIDVDSTQDDHDQLYENIFTGALANSPLQGNAVYGKNDKGFNEARCKLEDGTLPTWEACKEVFGDEFLDTEIACSVFS